MLRDSDRPGPFNGYKRLAQTSCNVDGKLIAFVGPNEARKSTVLEALAWLDTYDGKPLPDAVRTRDQHPQDSLPVVSAIYQLEEDDRASMREADIGEPPTTYKVSEFADGKIKTEASPITKRANHELEKAVRRGWRQSPLTVRLSLERLTYQAAPGLANAPADDPLLGEVAARTAYLVDGDKGGTTKKAQLVTAGVPTDHVLTLPTGQANEDC